MMVIEVALIAIGESRWAALSTNGSVVVADTRHPRPDVAVALLRQGHDPRSMLVIRAGSKLVVSEMLGVVAGGNAMAGDLGAIERDSNAKPS